MKPKLLCILGETASGKDSVVTGAIQKLYDYKIRPVCSYTDRPMRSYETNGVEHYFVSTDEFTELYRSRKDDILAYTHIKNSDLSHPGYHYMAFMDELQHAQLYIIDYLGLQTLQKFHGDEVDIVTVYIYSPLDERMDRARKTRSDFDTEFENRVKSEYEQFRQFRINRLYDYKINNTNGRLENSINRLALIIRHELIRADVPNSPYKNAIKNK